MSNLIVSLIIILIICASVSKIIIERKKGVKCIGCPESGAKKNGCGCSSSK